MQPNRRIPQNRAANADASGLHVLDNRCRHAVLLESQLESSGQSGFLTSVGRDDQGYGCVWTPDEEFPMGLPYNQGSAAKCCSRDGSGIGAASGISGCLSALIYTVRLRSLID